MSPPDPQRAASFLRENGPTSTRDMERALVLSRTAMACALRRACKYGWVRLVTPAILGRTNGRPAVWESTEAAPKEDHDLSDRIPVLKVTVSCVWDYAAGRIVELPGGKGRKFVPLGEW